ncbi:MAG: MMPL family transporter [Paenibacillaceae bacterium]
MSKDKSITAAKETIKHMVPAVGISILAGALGFSALYISPVPMVQDFGKMLKFGVIISFVASIFFLMPILFTRDHFFAQATKKRKLKASNGAFEKILGSLTRGTLKLGPIILTIALLLTIIGVVGDMKVGVETDVEKFMPEDTQELQEIHELRDILGTTDQVVIMYEGANLLEERVIRWVDHQTESLADKFPDVVVNTKSITSIFRTMNHGELPPAPNMEEQVTNLPKNQLKMVITDEQDKGVILVGVKHLGAEDMKQFIDDLRAYIEPESELDLGVTLTGKSVLDVEMISALTTGRYQMTLLGIGLVFLVLLAVYRHFVKALVAIMPISLIIGWSGGLMYVFGFEYTPLTATLGALVIGIGTEFTILIMERFYEERRKGRDRQEAIMVAIQKIGKAIIASGLTVIGGFSALIISDFVILSNFGMMTVINMTLCLVSTLIVLPPTLVLFDRLVKTKEGII